MTNGLRLEHLPNELFLEIFQYIDARMLYQSFSRLNNRLTILLASLTQLWLVLRPLQADTDDHLFATRVHTLVVHNDVSYSLARYVNIRRVILSNCKGDQISQLMLGSFHLESIALISPRCFYSTFLIHEMIFSNQFPRLKSCYLTSVYSPSFEVRQLSWNACPSLRTLRISSRDSLIHVAILNACPNLIFLHLSIDQFESTSSAIKPHRNLKELNFIVNYQSWPVDEMIFETFFSSIPCLERLTIERTSVPTELIHFDCLGKMITEELLLLRSFRFLLHLCHSKRYEMTSNLCQIQKNFVNTFPDQQYYRLYINIQ